MSPNDHPRVASVFAYSRSLAPAIRAAEDSERVVGEVKNRSAQLGPGSFGRSRRSGGELPWMLDAVGKLAEPRVDARLSRFARDG